MQKAIDYEPNYVPAYLVMGSWYAERGDALKGQQYTDMGLAIVRKYRDLKPTELYERILLGRPEAAPPDNTFQTP